jgi:hypothetical protein
VENLSGKTLFRAPGHYNIQKRTWPTKESGDYTNQENSKTHATIVIKVLKKTSWQTQPCGCKSCQAGFQAEADKF